MRQAIRAIVISGVIVLLSSGCFAQGRRTITNPDGSKEVLDTSTGWTETDRNGKTTNMSAADLTSVCDDLETAVKWHLKDTGEVRVACDEWAKLQPQTQIEQVPFSRLITRLLEISPPYTDFARYRGMELKSDAQATLYDATIVPNDMGKNVSCTVLQARDPSGGMLYKYECSLKTSSYPAAIELENTLVSLLDGRQLVEDHVTEHGFAVGDKTNNECAPTGECTHTHMYVSAVKDGKIVEIGAEPDFIRSSALDAQMLMTTGRHNFAEELAPDSATLTFSVYSHGPERIDASPNPQ